MTTRTRNILISISILVLLLLIGIWVAQGVMEATSNIDIALTETILTRTAIAGD
jgi:hypothetical protein